MIEWWDKKKKDFSWRLAYNCYKDMNFWILLQSNRKLKASGENIVNKNILTMRATKILRIMDLRDNYVRKISVVLFN